MTRKEARIASSEFFLLRTPLLPFEQLATWSDGLEAVASLAEPDRLGEALAQDRARLRHRLAVALARPDLREAIFLASPNVEEFVEVWLKDPDGERGRRLEPTLVAYFSRAASRATPFGLFAGCTTGSVSEQTRLRLHGRERYQRHTRLDMDYLWALAESLDHDSELRSTFCYRPNSSLYEIAGRLRLAEARQTSAGRSYHLVAVDSSPYLSAVLERARGGAGLRALAEVLMDDEISQSEAEAYVGELIDSQILVADLWPKVTGDSAAGDMTSALARHPQTAPLGQRLEEVRGLLQEMDTHRLGVPPERYHELAEVLRTMPATPTLSRLVQVDMRKPAEQATLGGNVVAELIRGVDILHRLGPAPEGDGLSRFRDAFVERYEDREVPLVEALDEETGIGFDRSTSPLAEASPLLAGLPFPSTAHAEEARWSGSERMLLEKLTEAPGAGRTEIRLEAADLAALPADSRPPLPDAFHVMATVVAESDTAVDAGRFSVFLGEVRGPSGAQALGRFCQLDELLSEFVRDHLRAEERRAPDCVYAEIVHLPEGRVGNILSRPVLREHEIPYLARSGAPADSQIPLTDLLVSVRDGRIVLRSRRLEREVLPRLTTAHAFGRRSLSTYRFLCTLQHQGIVPLLTWSWGPLGAAPFLPRVVSGRIVLSRAQWRLRNRDVQLLTRPMDAAQFAAIQRWRAERRLPRYVALVGDNELVLDLDNVLSVATLAHQLRGRRQAALVEMFPAPDELCVRGPEGRFVSEVIIPFVRTNGTEPTTKITWPSSRSEIARRFPPGSSWLYAKLYGGAGTADRVLQHLRKPALEAVVASGAARHWFFIRYADPDPHLRLRWQGEPGRLHAEVLPVLLTATEELLDTGQLWRVSLDTYEREVERYGGHRAVALAEQIFAADSEAVLAIVCSLSGDIGLDLRWRLALAGMDLLFDDLGLGLPEKREVARRAREGFSREFRVGGNFRARVSKRFRAERDRLEEMLTAQAGLHEIDVASTSPLAGGLVTLRRRSRRSAPVMAQLRQLAESGELAVPLADLAHSFAHMHVNRSLRSAQRAQELVLYELLDRIYSSQAGRQASRR